MDHNNISINKSLKRLHPNESDEMNSKRSKYNDEANKRIYPNNHPIPHPHEDYKSPLKPITITTKTTSIPSTTSQPHYEHINHMLHSLHVNRHGNPDLRERWWEHEEAEVDDMEIDRIEEYNSMNSMLKQLFLQRHKLI